jgi:hypothetical protein
MRAASNLTSIRDVFVQRCGIERHRAGRNGDGHEDASDVGVHAARFRCIRGMCHQRARCRCVRQRTNRGRL